MKVTLVKSVLGLFIVMIWRMAVLMNHYSFKILLLQAQASYYFPILIVLWDS